ncbi:hypothetical protein BDV29DRAFT_169471 [Aspergillus leporis]|jgi:4-aminobutyrate aminotransferase-like enzyme|uniref:Uncharacterized protein n=1 Tax=Aspergillus leporis TaxID=41062 RepID=A0A5N5X9N8_9EURO|nr:hypothetical protein BDV29DRAFT_169471 [Aspergillus leporis]
MGVVLGYCLREHLGNEDFVGDIRGRGLFYAVEFSKDRIEKKLFDPRSNSVRWYRSKRLGLVLLFILAWGLWMESMGIIFSLHLH